LHKQEHKNLEKKLSLFFSVVLTVLLLTSIIIIYGIEQKPKTDGGPASPFYVGVMYCGDTTEGAKLMIDKVKSYSNLFVQSNSQVAFNESNLNQVCQYATEAGMSFIVNLGTATYYDFAGQHIQWTWQYQWLDAAKERWGSKFLGVYYYDEPGGIHADANWENITGNPKLNTNQTYDTTAWVYHYFIGGDQGLQTLISKNITVFTSEYALYWFDYEAGYDVILGEIISGSNNVQTTSMVRGAANMQNKDWGITITWSESSNPPPYLGSPDEIYSQMLTAYQCGAKYVMFFDYPTYPEGNPYGILNQTYFNVFQKFWNDIHAMPPETYGVTKADTALVLPRNYGWGMRSETDKIWGAWGPDEKSPVIWNISRVLLSKFGYGLDIIYEDSFYPIGGRYQHVYYWNSTFYG
jgi:hypothetical protein